MSMVTGSLEIFLYSIESLPAVGEYFPIADMAEAKGRTVGLLNSFIWTQLAEQRWACMAVQPISSGLAVSRLRTKASFGFSTRPDLSGTRTTSACMTAARMREAARM